MTNWRYIDPFNTIVEKVQEDGTVIRLPISAIFPLPEDFSPDPYVEPDWRPDAIAKFNVMRKSYMDTLTSMQMDYRDQGKTANADAVLQAKQILKTLEKHPLVLSVYLDPSGTREQFEQIVKQAWFSAIETAPAEVLSDFPKYGGNAL